MILSDRTIRSEIEKGFLKIEPFDPVNVQPASYDLTLGGDFLTPQRFAQYDEPIYAAFEAPPPDLWTRYAGYGAGGPGFLKPNGFALVATVERVTVPSDTVGRIEGKSSLGRLGLMVHTTAGFIDPGFSGQITLELKNIAPWGLLLPAGMKIAQIAFERLDQRCERPYGHPELGSHYQGQEGPTAARA